MLQTRAKRRRLHLFVVAAWRRRLLQFFSKFFGAIRTLDLTTILNIARLQSSEPTLVNLVSFERSFLTLRLRRVSVYIQ